MLEAKHKCTGCTACAMACPKGCVSMIADPDGFPYPIVDDHACVHCGICQKVCPVLQSQNTSDAVPMAYAAYSKDEGNRVQSSSGGIFTELARAVIAQKGVVFGAAYDTRFDVVHIRIEDEEGLTKLRGAKYAQSNLGNTLKDVEVALLEGREVLFSGTPCQVAGLKSYLQKDYDHLICVDFVCHGVPSPMAWKAYVKYCAQSDNDGIMPKSINL